MVNEKISVVVPVYGCDKCLIELYERTKNTLENLVSGFEIIMVYDVSPDNSWSVIKQLSAADRRVKGIKFSRNFGQHYAITAGLDHSSGDWIVVMDCDLQDRPEEIQKLYEKARQGFDVVLGKRIHRQDSILKKLGSKLFYKLFSYLTETRQDETVANFGIYNRKVIDTIVNMRESLRFFPTMVRWIGFEVAAIEIQHSNRESGKTTYSFKKLVTLALNVIISFSDKPLRLSVKLGLIMSLLSFAYATYIVGRAILGIKGIEGWSSLIVSIWFLSGLIIFLLGIIGIYISKIFEQVKQRPIYIVKETIGFEMEEIGLSEDMHNGGFR